MPTEPLDAKPGPTAGDGTSTDTSNDVSTKTKKPKLGLLNVPKALLGGADALTGHAPDPGAVPGLISKIPQRIAGLVSDHTPEPTEASSTTTGGARSATQLGSRGTR